MFSLKFVSLSLALCVGVSYQAAAANARPAQMADITEGLKLIDEIDTASVEPNYESAVGVSVVQEILGRQARVIPTTDDAAVISYVIGKDKGLEKGKAYILTVDYPDDVPRTIFMANRGADYVRGWATGEAIGDVREQFVEPSVESLSYPQTGQWQTFKQYFHLLDRFQGVKGFRDPQPGSRPHGPEEGFNVAIFQPNHLNSLRSEGAAVGKIRLYEVGDPEKLYAPISFPPADLPRRHIFWREEMADEVIKGMGDQRAVADSVDWYIGKMKMAKVLGINTFTKDLLEFGHNQGWDSGDSKWVVNPQPPNTDLWTRLVPAITAEGLEIMPYYEYKGSIGMAPDSFAKQKLAKKLYHGKRGERYTGVFWVEDHNADLTDPETLEDFKRILDKTVVQFQDEGKFAGIWLRTRNTHLPISFSDEAIARFKEDHPEEGKDASQDSLIESYEGDKVLYAAYLDWWFDKRAQFLTAVRDYLREELGSKDLQVLFTPWVKEAVPSLHPADKTSGHPGVVTDDVDWWKSMANSMEEPWWKWHLMPTEFQSAVDENLYGTVLETQAPVYENGDENWHSAPGADPLRYKDIEDVAMTYPVGRLFTTSNPASLEPYESVTGPTVVRFYPLNEDNGDPKTSPAPFDNLMGYICVDCDRAGPHMLLDIARAVAYAAPRNIGYLSGSSFSTGFPEIMRRFNQAFLAVPALPSTRLEGASDNPEVVVRQIETPKNGTYFYVVNTSMHNVPDVKITLPGKGGVVNLVTGERQPGNTLSLAMDPADLLAFHVAP